MEQSINNDQTKLDESKSMESFTENVLSFHSTFISEFNDQLLNFSSMLNNRFNVYLNEIGTVLNEIQLDLNQWTSYVDSKLRLEKWLNMVEFDWKVNQLTDSDEVGDNLTSKMYFVTLYKVCYYTLHVTCDYVLSYIFFVFFQLIISEKR